MQFIYVACHIRCVDGAEASCLQLRDTFDLVGESAQCYQRWFCYAGRLLNCSMLAQFQFMYYEETMTRRAIIAFATIVVLLQK